jgi:hypothetical protein
MDSCTDFEVTCDLSSVYEKGGGGGGRGRQKKKAIGVGGDTQAFPIIVLYTNSMDISVCP